MDKVIKQSLIILIIWNIAIRAVAILGYYFLPQHYAPLSFISSLWKNNFIFWSFANFDGEHYLAVAKFGYQIRNGFPEYAFFPLFPLLIHTISFFLRDVYLSGMIVAQLSLWVALIYITKWCQILKLKNISLPLLVSTGAVFLSSIYTEPLFIALAAMTMYFSEKKWWGRAALTTALATATRVNGILLAVFLFVKLLKSTKSILKSGVYSLVSISGLFAYMFYLWQKTGDALAWFHAQGAWGKAVATSPITTLTSYLRAITIDFSPDLIHLVVVFEVATTAFAIYLFIKLLTSHRLDLSYWLYLALNLALPLATGSLGSMPRFFLTLFPLLSIVPSLPKLSKTLYYTFSISVGIIGIILFTRGYWYG